MLNHCFWIVFDMKCAVDSVEINIFVKSNSLRKNECQGLAVSGWAISKNQKPTPRSLRSLFIKSTTKLRNSMIEWQQQLLSGIMRRLQLISRADNRFKRFFPENFFSLQSLTRLQFRHFFMRVQFDIRIFIFFRRKAL